MEGTTPHRGNKATVADFDDLLHFEGDFIRYIKENKYPFINDYYKLRANAKMKGHTFPPMTSEEEFLHFLKFVKNEYGLVLSDELVTGHKPVLQVNNFANSLNDSLLSQSHLRMRSLLTRY